MVLLIEKLSDSNQRVRDSAKRSLTTVASTHCAGPAIVSSCALRPHNAKQKSAWRPLQSRLLLLQDLIAQYGVGGQSGLNSDSIMSFMRGSNAFAHSNGEVREAAKDLTIQLQKLVGTAPLESYLDELRPKQREEYFLSFEAGKKYVLGTDDSGKKIQTKGSARSGHSVSPKQTTTSDTTQIHSRADNSSSRYEYKSDEHIPARTSSSDAAPQRPASAAQPVHVCQFCGAGDARWTEDLLDEHYLSSCPYLAPCPECTQVS